MAKKKQTIFDTLQLSVELADLVSQAQEAPSLLPDRKLFTDVELGRIPNIRRLMIPNPGYIMIDMDLDRADAQVVAYEANDTDLKRIFREGLDLHSMNAAVLFNVPLNAVTKAQRQFAKIFCHATNYGARPRRLASSLGIPLLQATHNRNQWLKAHPGILQWHESINHSLATTRSVRNKFGYRCMFFDRIESCFNAALAWIPQSTVALVINRAWQNLSAELPEVIVSLQVHDSLTMQVRREHAAALLPLIQKHSLIPIPYEPEPLTIPVGFSISSRSWGDCFPVTLRDDGIYWDDPSGKTGRDTQSPINFLTLDR